MGGGRGRVTRRDCGGERRYPVIRRVVLVAQVVVGLDNNQEKARRAEFARDGWAVIRGFSGKREVEGMRRRMGELAEVYWRDVEARAKATVFVTDEGQKEAQAKSAYFMGSAREVRFFEEPDKQALNKAGHGLHLGSDVFGRYTRSSKVARLARVLGLIDPIAPQSMYIFKAARSGGAVTSHQDASFLRTWPRQTVIGFWLAIDDATLDNGCLWVRNASHVEATRRYFVRRQISSENDLEMTFQPTTALGNDYLDERWIPPSKRTHNPAPWEGSDLDKGRVVDLGFSPVPVDAGDLVVFAGTLDHLSLPNTSPFDRHTFQLHLVESHRTHWCDSNWLQYHDHAGGGAENSSSSYCDRDLPPPVQPDFPHLTLADTSDL